MNAQLKSFQQWYASNAGVIMAAALVAVTGSAWPDAAVGALVALLFLGRGDSHALWPLAGVAVLAPDYWTAKKGRDALKVEWDESAAYRGSSDGILADYRKLAATPAADSRSPVIMAAWRRETRLS